MIEPSSNHHLDAKSVTLDYYTLERMRQSHPAWRLLKADQAPLVASFLHRVFVVPNVRVMSQSELAEALEDELFLLEEQLGEKAYPKSGVDYLNDWAANDKGWLRKFYPIGTDEPHFDLTPSTEKAISWLSSLTERTFVGTESRLLMLFELLKQMSEGSETDAELRLNELRKRREKIDLEMTRILSGDIAVLDDTGIRDRFQQFVSVARELLSDFREVEHNFRCLDRSVRERIALFEGKKGDLLGEIMGERDTISDSDQGRSFRAFWDFLMSTQRQDELTDLLTRVLALPAVSELEPDPRLSRIHYDWLEAGESTQRTVAQLSQQLRRFLDDAAWLENRRIMDILREVESKAVSLRDEPLDDEVMTMELPVAEIDLPFERPLYSPPLKPKINSLVSEAANEEVDASSLFSFVRVDKDALRKHIRRSLQERVQVTLAELTQARPLEFGLSELVTYLQLATESFDSLVDEDHLESINWTTEDGITRVAELPRVVFVR